MPRTPDRHIGPALEEGTYYEDVGVAPTTPGEVRYRAGSFEMRDSVGTFNPRSTGSTDLAFRRHFLLMGG
jgi:hypothetical protein